MSCYRVNVERVCDKAACPTQRPAEMENSGVLCFWFLVSFVSAYVAYEEKLWSWSLTSPHPLLTAKPENREYDLNTFYFSSHLETEIKTEADIYKKNISKQNLVSHWSCSALAHMHVVCFCWWHIPDEKYCISAAAVQVTPMVQIGMVWLLSS